MSVSGTEPVTLLEAKQQLRIDYDSDDTYIEQLIKAARSSAEAYLKTALITKVVQTVYHGFCDTLHTHSRIASLQNIAYYDTNETQQTLTESDVYVSSDEDGGAISSRTEWPEISTNRNEVLINYTIEPHGMISEDIKAAILLTVTDLYEHRSDSVREKKTASEVFLNRYRIPTL